MPISKVISKDRPDHSSLDFDVLRAEGIQHLENFATELWTDYNAHDPGITLLELLCYAITDLSYRTRLLPIEDLMASPGPNKNTWFSASEVLPTAPVTILDYRKLLIDLKGVKNAWLLRGHQEVAFFSQGVDFPELSDETGHLQVDKLRAFYEANWQGIFPNESMKPDINVDLVLTKITEEQEEIKLYPLIQLYIEAIKEARLERKAKLTLLEQFRSQGQEITLEQRDKVYDYTRRFPFERELPKPDPNIEEEFNLLKLQYPTYQAFFEGAVNDFDYQSLGTEEDPFQEEDIQIVRNYLLGIRVEPLEPGSAAEAIFQALPRTTRGSGPLERKRNKILQERYRETVEPPNLNNYLQVEEYFREEPELQELFSRDFKKRMFLDTGNLVGWVFEVCHVVGFLSNAFNIEDDLILAVTRYHQLSYDISEKGPEDEVVKALFSKYFCDFGIWKLGYDEKEEPPGQQTPIVSSSISLNGLYTLLLDLDENIDTGIPNLVDPILERVKKIISANRGLCEDYVEIKIVRQRPIEVCLSLEVEAESDEIEVLAEALRKMQEYLSPVPRFRTFAKRLEELRKRGDNHSAEQIYNGPLLDNGFLEDTELGDDHPRVTYHHSDMVREILSVNGIVGLPVLRVESTPEVNDPSNFLENTTYNVYSGDFIDQGNQYYKPVIDIQKSYFEVTKGARTFRLNTQQIEERLNLLRLIHSSDPLDPPGGPTLPAGIFRPDLSSYPSLQYDLPATYMVGDHRPPEKAVLKRHAQVKHLQAYLSFFDQILASYLAQLGQVRQLLSVDQDASAPTRVLPLLYDMPGLRELIGEKAAFVAEPLDWTIIIQKVREDLTSISKGRGNTDKKPDRMLVQAWLQGLLEEPINFAGFHDLEWRLRTELSITASPPPLLDLYSPLIHDHFWEKFKADKDNYYAKMLKDLTESPAVRQRRKNELLDHLLARFGESFSTYAAALLRPEAEPEDNPRQQTFQEYLEAKADFLREVASLAMDRNLGYNYRAFRELENVSDVWNTDNVSGLQRRVVRKLGIQTWETRSLIATPAYRIDRIAGRNRRGMANYKAALRRRLSDDTATNNPEEAVPLLISPPYASTREVQSRINELFKYIWQASYFDEEASMAEINATYWFRLRGTAGGKFRAILVRKNTTGQGKKIKQGGQDVRVDILLQSELLSRDEAIDRIVNEVIPLVKPNRPTRENEGFHIVEHILLRPQEVDDPLLQLHLGCVPEETPKDPYSFWITVVAPAETTRFSDKDFRAFFEHEFRMETPAHIAVRFCYLGLDDMYKFEEAFAIWMFEKAKCDPPNYCRVDEAAAKLIQMLNTLNCSCPCSNEPESLPCGQE